MNVLNAVFPVVAVAVFVSIKLPVRPNDPTWPEDPGLAVPNIDGGAAAGTPKSPAPLFWNGLAMPLMPPPPVREKILERKKSKKDVKGNTERMTQE